MRERLDFSSISKIILENRKAESFSYYEYYETLFYYAFEQQDIKISQPDMGNINKIINGERNVPKDIFNLYEDKGMIGTLANGVSKLLNEIADPAFVNEQLGNLLWNDPDISIDMKEKISNANESLSEFIARCLLFGMTRNFISRIKRAEGSSRKKSFLLSDFLIDYHYPSVNKVFFGRENDLGSIHSKLIKHRVLFLEGIGGIGKSELAKQYGKRFAKEYDNVLFIRFTETLKKTISELAFVDDKMDMPDETLFKSHYRFFKQLSNDTLVILDNFDTIPENEELFYEFLSMPFQLLITTRSNFEDVPVYHVGEIDTIDELLELFYTYAPDRNKPQVVAKIIEEVYRHTLTVEMAAKTLTVAEITPEELLSSLRKEGIALSNPNKIKITKDSIVKKDKLHKHIQTLFTLQNLSGENLYILLHMVLVPDKGLLKGLFKKWIDINDFNDVNDLIDYGWIQYDNRNNRISLHPFLHDVIADFSKPKISTCGHFIKSIYQHCFNYGEDTPYYHDVLSTIESMFENIQIDDSKSAFMLFDKTISYLGKYRQFDRMSRLLDLMNDCISMDENHSVEKATYELYRGIVAGGGKGNIKAGIEHIQKGLAAIKEVNSTNAETVSHLYSNLANFYAVEGKGSLQIACAEKAIEIGLEYHLPTNHDSFVQEGNLAIAYIMNNQFEKGNAILEKLIDLGKRVPNFGVTLGELYACAGLAM